MLKSIFAVAALTTSIANASCEHPLLSNFIKETNHPELIQCKTIPNGSGLTVFFIPSDGDPDSAELDLDILVVNESGTVVSGVFKPKEFTNLVTSTNIDTANYKLNDQTRAFGIDYELSNGSDTIVNRDLYIIDGRDVKMVSDDIGISNSKTKRTIDIGLKATNGYNNLIVKEGKKKYELTFNPKTGMYDVPAKIQNSF